MLTKLNSEPPLLAAVLAISQPAARSQSLQSLGLSARGRRIADQMIHARQATATLLQILAKDGEADHLVLEARRGTIAAWMTFRMLLLIVIGMET